MKLIVIALFASILFLYIGESKSKVYGRGLHTHYSDIVFGTKVTKLNKVYITSDKNWKYESYVSPGTNYVTINSDTIFVKSLEGYCSKNGLSIFVRNNNERLVKLYFDSRRSVYSNSPKVSFPAKVNCDDYINLKEPPVLIKYWGLFNPIAYLLIFVLSISCFVLGYRRTRNKRSSS